MQGVPAQSGAFIAVRRPVANNPFYPITLIQPVKNVTPQGDFVNLPAYVAGPPTGRRP